jgi:thermitase
MVMALARGPLCAALLLPAAIVPAAAHGAPAFERESLDSPYLPERAIVRYEPGAVAGDRAAARASARVSLQRSLTVGRAELVSFSGPVGEAVARLERQAGVADAQPDYRYRATAPDTFFEDLWGLADTALPDPGVAAAQAWATTKGAGQLIAVVDSGVDLTHPDLDGNLWSNPGELPNGSDDDDNGHIDDLHGFDFVDRDADPDDYEFHGTHVAGTAAAELDNGEGIAGVAPDAEIMPVRVLDGNGGGFSSEIGDGIAYAAREGATVINLSLGGEAGPDDSFMASAIAEADQRNVTVVAAAGNDARNNDFTPSTPCTFSHPNLICVAAVNQSGALAGFSNFGAATVDVGGPGTAILSTKSDWQAPVFSEGFEAGVSPLVWATDAGQNDIPWGETTAASEGTKAATDSPGEGVQYKPNSDTWLIKAAALSLSGRRGCRMHFDLSLSLGAGDSFIAGALTSSSNVSDGLEFAGNSGGYQPTEISISTLDGRSDVFPAFDLFSNAMSQADGAYVDRLRVFCRASGPYLNAITPIETYDTAAAGNYVRFNGTSMATPHVAGVAALVRAAAPGIADNRVADSIRAGAVRLPGLAGVTVSGGTASAPGAIAAALGRSGSSSAPSSPAPGGTAPPGGTTTTTTTGGRPGPAGFGRRFAVDRLGRLRMRIAGEPRLVGVVSLSATGKALAARRVRIARARFSLDARGRATVRLRLTRRARRALRRNGPLRARAAVELRNAAGLRSMTFGRIVLVRKR